jgi:mRNA interferase YafQ
MLKIRYAAKFKRDYKLAIKRGCNPKQFEAVVKLLCAEKPLPKKYKDHALTGNYIGHRECHINPDWLLIYKVEKAILILTLTRTGSHSDLF